VPPARTSIDTLIEASRQESIRADSKATTLLTIVGIGFTAFSVAGASAIVAPLTGTARWLSVAALASVCLVAELLLLSLRPALGRGLTGQQYFAAWRHYARDAERLAVELSAEVTSCQTLIQLSIIVWRKFLLVRWAVDLLMGVLPLVALSVSIALLTR